ncbi:MAG: nucleoside triphosphate pyrophosphohydrolase [Clostridia bacterium]|nr:nucleoside triphosphate pyrophosphohydrolase [Clostridia bacterium]
MKVYNKLVRDRIPEIIKSEGRNVKIKILNDEEYRCELNKKLQEEVKEYIEDNNIEELADIVEVIYGILNSMDVSIEEFEKVRKDKAEKRGAFKEKIFLEEAE